MSGFKDSVHSDLLGVFLDLDCAEHLLIHEKGFVRANMQENDETISLPFQSAARKLDKYTYI